MRTLVTGGAGFIGSHIVDRLLELGHEVIIIDNLASGFENNINPKAKFHKVDITDEEKMKEVFEKEKPEMVFHAAAQVFVSISTKTPQEDARINIIGSIILLNLCKNYGVKKIIYSNSGGAGYGNPEYLPMDEKHPINPISQYGTSKHTVDHYLSLYSKNFSLKYTSLGYANVYGPRQNPHGEGGVVAIFINKLLNNERPTIFGDGSHIRDYCYVNDVVDANIWAIDHGDNQIYNVGTGIGTTTQEVFDIIKKLLSLDLEPIYADEKIGDIKSSLLNSDKIQAEGWAPKYTFEDGIKQTIEYFRTQGQK